MATQLFFDLPQWGGARAGAGRPRTRLHPGLEGPGVPHLPRPDFAARHPVHVTMRLQAGVGYLRSQSRARIIREALKAARGCRVVHYSIQGNHLHLIVEAESPAALSRAIQRLATRVARRLNALARRSGGVFVDRYHSRPLKTPREVRNAIRYVTTNYRHHAREHPPRDWRDPLSTSADAPFTAPTVWLLSVGWRI